MKYRFMLISFFIAFAFVDQSLGADNYLYYLGKKQYKISMDQKYGLVSTACLDKGKKCQAVEAYSSAVDPKINLFGGARAGSIICRNQFKSKVLILKDTKKNENSFCEFDDGTLLEIGSLEKILGN